MKRVGACVLVVLALVAGLALWFSPSLGGLLPGGIAAPSELVEPLRFDANRSADVTLLYQNESLVPALVALRKDFQIDALVAGASTDFERVQRIQTWVQRQWQHDSDTVAERRDAHFILDEAKKGRRFRCVEYAFVTTQLLKSLGFAVRSVALKTRDVERVNYAAGHVVTEVYLADARQWIFLDPQNNIIATLHGVPLNAVELQAAIVNHQPLQLLNPTKTMSDEEYVKWIGPYLFFFTTSLNRGPVTVLDRLLGRPKELTLVPNGFSAPRYFQRLIRLTTEVPTHSVADFYPVVP